MNPNLKARFKRLSHKEKQLVLADLVWALTLASRSIYDAPESVRLVQMPCINEAIHVASDKLRALIANDSKQYPDDVFIDVLFEKAGPALDSELQRAFDSALTADKLQA